MIENNIYPPPPLYKNNIFPSLCRIVFLTQVVGFCFRSSLFCIYITLLRPFSLFPLSSFFFPLFSFFSYIFPQFSFPFIFPPQMTSADIPHLGGVIFQYIDSYVTAIRSTKYWQLVPRSWEKGMERIWVIISGRSSEVSKIRS